MRAASGSCDWIAGPPGTLTCITTSCEYAAKYVNGLSMSAKSFRLTVTDVFPNPPEGAILLGTIEQGEVSIGATILITAGLEEVRVSVTGIEIFRAVLQTATTGQEVGLRIRGVDPDLIAAGSIVKAADSN